MSFHELLIGFAVFVFVIILASAIKVAREYERAVIFRLGRLRGTKGPGLYFLIPLIDRRVLVDLRVLSIDVPRQQVITADNVSVQVDAVVYYRVDEPIQAIVKVRDFFQATNLLAQTTLRDVLGQVELDDLLSKREDLNRRVQDLLDVATDPWGIKVQSVTIRDVSLPDSMIRAIAKQAEAERERRGRIIVAQGEFQAAEKMLEAALLYAQSAPAMRLRELQTLQDIAREKNLIVVTTTGMGSRVGEMVAMAEAVKVKDAKAEQG
jgi:regulator of protease activity HflC (stomatin/prohibitin superfamily)